MTRRLCPLGWSLAIVALWSIATPSSASAQVLTIVSTDHDFGQVLVGDTDTVTVTIRNDDPSNNLVITGLSLTGASCTDLDITVPANTPPPNIPIDPGVTEDVVIEFAPLSIITLNCSLRITKSSPTASVLVPLTGNSAASELQVSTSSIDFGTTKTSSPPVLATFDIANVGTSGVSLTIDMITISGGAAFSINPPYPPDSETLLPGESFTVTVEFDPATQGAFAATVSITSDASLNPNDTVALLGDGVQAIIGVSPNPVNFADTRVNTDRDVIVSLGNSGNTTLNISSIALSGAQVGNFSIQGALPATVSAGGSQSITVRCRPLDSGFKVAQLDIASDDDVGNSALSIPIGCRGTDPPQITVNPLALDFMKVPVGSSAQLAMTVSNTSGPNGEDLIVDAPLVGGSEFSVVPSVGFILTAGETQILTVSFAPTGVGASAGTLTISSNDIDPMDSSIDIALAGIGEAAVLTKLQPVGNTLDFGIVRVTTTSTAQTLQIRNDGNVDLDISSVQIVGGSASAYRIASGPQASTVNPGAGEAWTVVCEPLQSQAFQTLNANLRITSNALGGNLTVSLRCEGGDVNLDVTPNSLSFGSVFVGMNSVARSVVLRNDGNLSVEVSGFMFSHADFRFGTVPPATPFTLAANGGTASFTVVFAPTLQRSYSETLDITTSDGAFSVALDGEGIDVIVLFDPLQPYGFGDVRVGTTNTISVTMRNDGTASFQVSSVAPGNTTDFAIENISRALPTTMVPGDSLAFDIVAMPQGVGLLSTNIAVVTNIPGTGTILLDASARGTAPGIVVSPSVVDFGPVDEQAVSAQRSITVTNDGTAALVLSSIAITGPDAALFALAAGSPTSAMLAPDASLELTVAFDPDEVAVVAAGTGLRLVSDALNETDITVPLRGRGIDRQINLNALQIDFADTYRNPIEAPTRSLAIQNLGEAPLTATMFMVGGMDPGAFRVVQDMPLTIGSLATETIDIAFDPSALGGFTSTLTIHNDDDNDPMARVQLSGNSVLRDVGVGPMQTVNFGQVPVCTVRDEAAQLPPEGADPGVGGLGDVRFPISISNLNATDPYELLDVRVTDMDGNPLTDGSFAVVDFTPVSIGPMSQVTVDVTFAPRAGGRFEARVELVLDVADEQVDAMVMLVGEGADYDPAVCKPNQTYYACECRLGAPASDGSLPRGPALPLGLGLAALAILRRRRRHPR